MLRKRHSVLLIVLVALIWPVAGLFATEPMETGAPQDPVALDEAVLADTENQGVPPITGEAEAKADTDEQTGAEASADASTGAIATGDTAAGLGGEVDILATDRTSPEDASSAQGDGTAANGGNAETGQVLPEPGAARGEQESAGESSGITIEAEQMDYDVEAKAVVATGNVIVRAQAGDLEIHADEMVYANDGWILVNGKAVVKYKTFLVEGVGLRYHVPSQSGELKRFKGDDGLFRISGDTIDFSPEYKLLKGGDLTSCERIRPCYRLKAGSIHIEGGRIIIKRGWLSVYGIPLVPIPYMAFNPNSPDTWPFVTLGATNERGGFAVIEKKVPFTSNWSVYGGIGLGTERWGLLGGGLEWKTPTDNLWNMEYNYMNDKRRLDSKLNYVSGPFTVKGSLFREWDDSDEFFGKITETLTLWKQQERSWAVEFSQERRRINDLHDKNRDNAQERYGGTIYGTRVLYSPNGKLTFGYGWVYGDGDLREFGIEDWAQEAVLRWKQPLNEKWAVEFKGAYHWSDDDEHWNEKLIVLSRNLHCFTAKLDWDGVDDEWGFSLELNL